jgi:hypothetical protein
MAYLDEEGFAKEAEAAGYSKEAIAAHIAKIRASDAAEKHDTVTRMLAPAAAASAAVAQPVVTPPAPAPVVAAPALPAITSQTTPAELFNMRRPGSTVERIGGMMGEAGTAAGNTASNATQDSLNYARDAIANNPELTGALAAIPLAYGANKLGLFDNLGSKMSASAAKPQPFVGGSGPRVTPLAPTASPIQNWDIHNEPALGNFLGDVTAPAATAAPATPAAAPSRNLTLEEAQARMAGVTPAAASVTPEVAPAKAPWAPPTAEVINKPSMFPSGSTIGTTPSRPVTPTPPAALASTATPTVTYPKKTTFKTAAEIPEGFVFRPDVGNLDRSMYNILGPEHRQQAKEFLTGGKMFGQSADVNADVSKLTNQYFQRLQSEIPETILGRDARKLQNVPSDFGVYGGKGGFGKAAKVAGVAGTLFAGADLANAAESAIKGDYAKAGGKAIGTAAGFIPPVYQLLTGHGNAGLSAEEEARQLRMRNYAERAGRGVAQGYDPRRLIGVAPPAR